jgi:predicted NAD-dependent protein-ADP-ribosyltransferase YbiA (DUF1768 family)
MSNIIKLFNKDDKPFGILGNNYVQEMTIDDQRWKTVTNYIYANLLKTSSYRNVIKNTKTKEIKEVFESYYKQSIQDTTRKAMDKAIEKKFKNDDLKELLISTGDSPLVYISGNAFMGMGVDNKGVNLLGKSLMQLRHRFLISYKEEKKNKNRQENDEAVYLAYLAHIALVDSIRNKDSNLREFFGKTHKEIVEKYGKSTLVNSNADKQTILNLYKKNGLSILVRLSIENPEQLVLGVRKQYLENLRTRLIQKRKTIVFDMYADYTLAKNFSNVEPKKYEEAKEQQFKNMDWQQKADLDERLYDLYTMGMLSETLSNRIDERLANLNIPSEEDVIESIASSIKTITTDKKTGTKIVTKVVTNKSLKIDKNLTVDDILSLMDSKDGNKKTFKRPDGSPIYFSAMPNEQSDPKYNGFSPISYTGMLDINGTQYPSISHYITASLFALLPSIRTMENAYPFILANPKIPVNGPMSFKNPELLTQTYNYMRDNSFHNELRKYTKIALDVKFENRVLQDVLVSTGYSKIEWADFSDPILGSGNRGENFVGKYLMTLRDFYNKEREGQNVGNLREADVTKILYSDPIIKAWLEMRVRDTCRVINVMKNYSWSKTGEDTKLNVAFVTAVLDKVYQPCSNLFARTILVKATVPHYFRMIVTNCPGFRNAGIEIVSLIWKRIAVMIYFLIKHIKESSLSNIRAVLGSIEIMVSQKTRCVEIVENQEDNCILSAIINILKGIVEFNKTLGNKTDITEEDIKTAASIIVNQDIGDEIKYIDGEEPDFIPDDLGQNKDSGFIVDNTKDMDDEDEFVFPDDINDYDDDEPPSTEKFDLLDSILQNDFYVLDTKDISSFIMGAVQTIKTYPSSKQIKQNRINFFSTIR